MSPAHLAVVSDSAGADAVELSLFDAVERAQTLLDEAEKLFSEGYRMAGMYRLGEAARLLEMAQ